MFMVVLFAYGFFFVQETFEVVAGYFGQRVTTGIFACNRTLEDIQNTDVSDFGWIPVEYKIDYKTRSVTVTVFYTLSTTVIYRDGFGSIRKPQSYDVAYTNFSVIPFPTVPKNDQSKKTSWPTGDNIDIQKEAKNNKFNIEALDKVLDQAIKEGARGVAVVYDGKLVAEKYAMNYSQFTPLIGWSMTKSVLNTLIGIRIRQKKMALNQTVIAPEWNIDGDPRKNITLDQLLRQSSGLYFKEKLAISGDCPIMLFAKSDIAHFAADKSLIAEPDTVWSYSSGTSNILSRALRHTFENDNDYWTFARRELFDKIGMKSAFIETDPIGTFMMSSFMYATVRDWTRFGLLYYNDGVWEGERILPEGWVKYSKTPTPLAPFGSYGAHFWLNAGDKNNKKNMPNLASDAFFASGFEQQYVLIVPSKKLVMARLGFNKPENSTWSRENMAATANAVLSTIN